MIVTLRSLFQVQSAPEEHYGFSLDCCLLIEQKDASVKNILVFKATEMIRTFFLNWCVEFVCKKYFQTKEALNKPVIQTGCCSCPVVMETDARFRKRDRQEHGEDGSMQTGPKLSNETNTTENFRNQEETQNR